MDTRRQFLISSAAVLALAACSGPVADVARGPDGQPLPLLYRIDSAEASVIEGRMRDRVNAFRRSAGAAPLHLNVELNAAAAAHSRDMAMQGRLAHGGSDGSSPVDRARMAGYRGMVLGENISETYAPELETIADWMTRADTRDVITDPNARDLGVAFHQEGSGKIWWTLVVGDGGTTTAANAPTR
jgi:uncharacterized protein YkwD